MQCYASQSFYLCIKKKSIILSLDACDTIQNPFCESNNLGVQEINESRHHGHLALTLLIRMEPLIDNESRLPNLRG